MHILSTTLLAALLLLPSVSDAFTEKERAYLSQFKALLEASPDPCKLAPRLESHYARLLKAAKPEQDVADIRKARVRFILAEGVRLSGGFALYDDDTDTVYLSKDSIARLLPQEEPCPADEQVRALAMDTVAVYVHEIAHSFEKAPMGPDRVRTAEGEILAYAREARFLGGLKGWPSKAVTAELKRRAELSARMAKHEKLLEEVQAMRGKEPDFDRLKELVNLLDKSKRRIVALQELDTKADPTQVSIAEMVNAYRAGWGDFIRFTLPRIKGSPFLKDREENLEGAKAYLEMSIKSLAQEQPGTIAYEMAQRGVKLAERDLRFWGDEEAVSRSLAFFERRFKDVRHP